MKITVQEARDMVTSLSGKHAELLVGYMKVLMVLDKLKDPELLQLNDEFQQKLKDNTLTRQEHDRCMERMRTRLKELAE